MDKLDFLDGAEAPNGEAVVETPAVEAPVAEAPAEEAAPVETEAIARERDEKGRFKRRKPRAGQTMVPLKALHETRDKVKALEAELQKHYASRSPQPSRLPIFSRIPRATRTTSRPTVQQATLNATLNLSEEMVRQSMGNESSMPPAMGRAGVPGQSRPVTSSSSPNETLTASSSRNTRKPHGPDQAGRP
jgi:hypothetical protein